MRKHSKFSALLLCAALGFSVSLESCKDYDDDIDNLQLQIDETKADLKALQDKIAAGAVITGVTSTAEGIVITLSDGKTYTITNGKNGTNGKDGINGTNGKDGVNGLSPIIGLDDKGNIAYRYSDTEAWKIIAPMPTISANDFKMEINKEGHLIINGNDLGQVVGANGNNGIGVESIYVDKETNKLMWEDTDKNKHEITGTIDFTKILTYTRNEEGKLVVNGQPTGLFIPEVYMTEEEGYYTLHMPVKDKAGNYVIENNKIKYSAIKLPTAEIVTLQQISLIPFSNTASENHFEVNSVTGVKQASWFNVSYADEDKNTYNHKIAVQFRVYPESYKVDAKKVNINVDQTTKAGGTTFDNIQIAQEGNLVTLTATCNGLINQQDLAGVDGKQVFSIVIDNVSSEYFTGAVGYNTSFDRSYSNNYSFMFEFIKGENKIYNDANVVGGIKLNYQDVTKGLALPYVFVDNNKKVYPEFTTDITIAYAEKEIPTGYLSAAEAAKFFTIDGMSVKAKEGLQSGVAIGKKARFHVWAKIKDAVIGCYNLDIELVGGNTTVIEPQDPIIPEQPKVLPLDGLTFVTNGAVKEEPALSDNDLIQIANTLGVSKAEAEAYRKVYEFKDAMGTITTITGAGHKLTYGAAIEKGTYYMTISIKDGENILLNVTKTITISYPTIAIEKVQGWWNNEGNCTVQGRINGQTGKWHMEVALDEVLKLQNATNNEKLTFEVTDLKAIATLTGNILTLNENADLSKNNILNFKAIITNQAGVVISETPYKVAFKNPLPNGLTADKKDVVLYNKNQYNTLNLVSKTEGEKVTPGIGIKLESAIVEHKAVVTDGNVANNNVFGANISFKLKNSVEGLSVNPTTGELTWNVTATGAVFTQINAVVIVTVVTDFGTKTMPINVTIEGADKIPAEK